MTFSEKLINFRVDNNLTQKKAAELIGVSTTIYSRWENGKVIPSLKNKLRTENIINNLKPN